MTISLLTPIIYSNQNRASFSDKLLSLCDSYFYLGGRRAYVIPNVKFDGKSQAYCQDDGPISPWEITLKVTTYATVIIPTLIFFTRCFLRHNREIPKINKYSKPGRVWHYNLKKIGMTKKSVKKINEYLDHNSGWLSDFRKSGITLRKSDLLPYTLHCIRDGIVLVSLRKLNIIGEGSQTTVKPLWDLQNGKMRIKKRVDEFSYHMYIKFPKERGIVNTLGSIKEWDHFGNLRKINVIQPKYQGTLADFLSNQDIDPKHILSIMADLLTGLATIHKLNIEYKKKLIIPFTHHDIKTDNILIKRKKDGTFKVSITDFGLSSVINSVCGSPLYISPEYASLKYRSMSKRKVVEYNFYYGQAKDIWALGLVFVTMLQSIISPTPHPDLDCFIPLNARVLSSDECTDACINCIALVSQRSLNKEIDNLQARIKPLITDNKTLKVFDVIKKMLRVNPNHRINVKDALKEIEQIKIN